MDGISASVEVIASNGGDIIIDLTGEDNDGEIMVSDMSEISASLDGRPTNNNSKGANRRPVRKTRNYDYDYHEVVDSGDEQENPKGTKRGRPKTKKTSLPVAKKGARKSKMVQEDDDDLSEVLSQPSITSSPVKKRGRRPKPAPAATNPIVSSSPSTDMVLYSPPSTSRKDGGERTKGVSVASSKAGGSLSAIQKSSFVNIHDLEQDEIIRPEDLVGFEDIEIYSQDMPDSDEDENQPTGGPSNQKYFLDLD